MFLYAQATPRPRRIAPETAGSEATGENGCAGTSGSSKCDRSEHASSTSGSVTPAGMTVWVMPMLPSRSTLRRRISTGSIPSASASLFIWLSATNVPWGPPKPRNAPPIAAFV